MTKQLKIPLSVFIITKNEEDRLSKAINSVKGWVHEIIVIDSGSTDNTIKIAKDLGAKVFHNDWNGYGAQKIFGEKKCSQQWILNIDADEAITADLRDEIINLFNQNKINDYIGYLIKISMTKISTDITPFFGPHHTFIRLYNKNKAGFSDSSVHDSVIVREGKVGKCKCIMTHKSFRSYTHALQKVDSYSTAQAHDMFAKGRNPARIRILFEPMTAFFKCYILKKSFILGFDGIILSYIYVIGRLMRLIKARDLFFLKNSKKQTKSLT
ncbi:MAG: glycosyltransferase family 2 protein [Rickettsiales bacterium]|nr:glycosyltransferase family 2 protein [Rickettsiales bacterium]